MRSSRRQQHGMTLVETMIVVVIAAIVAGSVALSQNGSAEKRPTSRRIIGASLTQAVAIAGSTGNGATVLFIPETNQAEIKVYGGRPNGQLPDATNATLVHTSVIPLGISTSGPALTSTVTGPSFAIFVNSLGHASFGQWTGPGAGTVSTTCDIAGGPLQINVIWDKSAPLPTESMRVPCGGSSFVAYDANNVIIPDLPAYAQ